MKYSVENDFEEELSTERIRSRMLKNAARIWGAAAEDIETTFDPIVTMLIEACAVELNKINSDILSSRARVLSRLARILSPEAMTGPRPAHSVANARSTDAESILEKELQLYTIKKVSSPDGFQKEANKEIYFSPSSRVKIFDGAIRYTACQHLLFEYKNPLSRQLVSENQSKGSLEPHTLWLGLELNQKVSRLDDMCFFFDWKNDPDESSYLQMLPLNRFYFENLPLTVQNGLNIIDSQDANRRQSMLTEQFDSSHQIETLVNKLYHPHFYTVTEGNMSGDSIHQHKKACPEEFRQVFSEKLLERLPGGLVWIKVQFSTAFPLSAISDAYVSINSFPVINRRLNKLTYRLQNSLNIIPLETNDFFLDLKTVETGEGKSFIANPLSSGLKNEAGYYTLRGEGIERFDARQSTELLNNILDLLRDESAAFSSLGNDFINGYIRQINQALAMIENRLNQKGQTSRPGNYVLVKPFQADDSVFIHYWTTTGPIGNQLKSGTRLQNYTGGETRSDSLMLMVSTSGGRDALNESEKIIAYRKALLTHDRIVTVEDILTTCQYELGTLADKISIGKDWEIIPDRTQGLRRVIEVSIRKNKNAQLSEQEWLQVCEELQVKLENRSAFVLPVRVVTE